MKKILLTFSILMLFIISGCKGDVITSKWKTSEITIDGNDSDWGNTLTYMKDSKLLFGVQNDNENLYLCLVTNDPDLENKIVRMGLTVWLDREGGDRHVFGIKYPLSFQELGRSSSNRSPEDMNRQPMDRNQIDERLLSRQTEVEIIGKSKDDVTRIPISELKGLKLKVGIKDYRMVYEMQIPLHPANDAPYIINADTGSTVSIGLITGTIDRSKFNGEGNFRQRHEGGESADGSEQPEGGMGEGGMRERGEGGGYRRQRGTQNSNSMEPLEFWAEVKLASQSAK